MIDLHLPPKLSAASTLCGVELFGKQLLRRVGATNDLKACFLSPWIQASRVAYFQVKLALSVEILSGFSPDARKTRDGNNALQDFTRVSLNFART